MHITIRVYAYGRLYFMSDLSGFQRYWNMVVDLGDIVGSVPDHCNKATITIE